MLNLFLGYRPHGSCHAHTKSSSQLTCALPVHVGLRYYSTHRCWKLKLALRSLEGTLLVVGCFLRLRTTNFFEVTPDSQQFAFHQTEVLRTVVGAVLIM